MKKALKIFLLKLFVLCAFTSLNSAHKSEKLLLREMERISVLFIKQTTQDFFKQIQETPGNEPIQLKITEKASALGQKLTLKMIKNWLIFPQDETFFKKIGASVSKAMESIINSCNAQNEKVEYVCALAVSWKIFGDLLEEISLATHRANPPREKKIFWISSLIAMAGIVLNFSQNKSLNDFRNSRVVRPLFLMSIMSGLITLIIFPMSFEKTKGRLKNLKENYKKDICEKLFSDTALKTSLNKDRINVLFGEEQFEKTIMELLEKTELKLEQLK